MEASQEKVYSFFGNDTFPNPYDALVYERKFKSEYLERQIYVWTFQRQIYRESKRTLVKANFISS